MPRAGKVVEGEERNPMMPQGTIGMMVCAALALGAAGCSPGWMAFPSGGRYRSSVPGETARTPARSASERTSPGEFASVPSVEAASAVKLPRRTAGDLVYEVRSGDTLQRLAARFVISADRIREANGLDFGSDVREGQLLMIPRQSLSASESSGVE
jgi:hypothetical protein